MSELYKKALKKAQKENFDKAEVVQLLNQAIEKDGSHEAAYALATWYLHGVYFKKNYEKAAELLAIACNGHHSSACYDLAVCYETGQGTRKDKKKALQLYVKAALFGDIQSTHEVGRCYYYGIGTKEDRDLADIWLERAEFVGIKLENVNENSGQILPFPSKKEDS